MNGQTNYLPPSYAPETTVMPMTMENNIWLLIVKGILLLLSGHNTFIILCRSVRIFNRFRRINLRQQQNSLSPPSVSITGASSTPAPARNHKISYQVEQLSSQDLDQVRLISLAMLSAPLCVNLLQMLIIYLDHFQGICLCTAFALVALSGNFKSGHDPTGQLNLVILVLSKTLFAFLLIANKSNFYNGRRKRRFSLELEKTFNTYSLKR